MRMLTMTLEKTLILTTLKKANSVLTGDTQYSAGDWDSDNDCEFDKDDKSPTFIL